MALSYVRAYRVKLQRIIAIFGVDNLLHLMASVRRGVERMILVREFPWWYICVAHLSLSECVYLVMELS